MFSAPNKEVPIKLVVRTFTAMALWMLIFSCGLLIETVEHRYQLAPRSVSKQVGEDGMKSIHGYGAAQPNADGQPKYPTTDPSLWTSIKSFFITMICYTPINLALLTLMAGLIGGHASNISIQSMSPEQLADLKSRHPRRDLFLQEPPISAAIRGFVVFLCVVAGLYVAMDDPFKDPTPGQYIRLAGSISVMAFLVGYDASRLEDWLSVIPGPASKTRLEGDQNLLAPANVGALAEAAVKAHENDSAPAQESADGIPETLAEAEKKSLAADADHLEPKESDPKVTTIQVTDVKIAQVSVADKDAATVGAKEAAR